MTAVPDELAEVVRDGAGSALGVAGELGPAEEALASAARAAFGAGLATSRWIGAAVLAVTAVG